MAEARRTASALASASSGTVSGENDNGTTQKQPRAETSGNEKASSQDLPVAFEGLVIAPPPEPSLVSRPTPLTPNTGDSNVSILLPKLPQERD